MSRKAKDGTEYTNQMMVNKHNMRMDAQKEPTQQQPQQPSDNDTPDSSQPTDNPDADQHVDAMLQSGMSPDDIHEHAKKRAGHSHSGGGMGNEPMPSKGLSSVPGM